MSNKLLSPKLIFSIKCLFFIFCIYYLTSNKILTVEVLELLFTWERIPVIAAAGTLFVLAQTIAAFRLYFLLRGVNHCLKFWDAIRAIFIGNFFNIVIPGEIGGDIFKIAFINSRLRLGLTLVSTLVMVDRLVGLFTLISLSLFSIVYLVMTPTWSEISFGYFNLEMSTLGLLSVCALAILTGLFLRHFSYFLDIIFSYFPNSLLLHKAVAKLTLSIKTVKSALSYQRSLLLVGISIVVYILTIYAILLLSNDHVLEPARIISFSAVTLLVMISGILPVTPGNLGWTELIAAAGWASIGSAEGAATFLAWRMITIVCSLPGGLLYLLEKGPQTDGNLDSKTNTDTI